MQKRVWPILIVLIATSAVAQVPGDTNSDNCIDIDELVDVVDDWKNGVYTMDELIQAIKQWKQGCTQQIDCEVLVIGASTGGTIAAIASARAGADTCLTEETHLLGGQYTAQGLPVPDEGYGFREDFDRMKQGIEFLQLGIYREHIDYVHDYYKYKNVVDKWNPGKSWVTRWSHEPQVSKAFFDEKTQHSNLRVFMNTRVTEVKKQGNKVIGAKLENTDTNSILDIDSDITIDGTELGDVIHLSGAPYRIGIDSKEDTGESTAASQAQISSFYNIPTTIPFPYGSGATKSGLRVQPFTVLSALGKNMGGTDFTLPADLQALSSTELKAHFDDLFDDSLDMHNNEYYVSYPDQRGFMDYRRILHKTDGKQLTMINHKNDYQYAIASEYIGTSSPIPYDKREEIFEEGKEFSRRYEYFIQDIWPHWKHQDILWTDDGFAAYPYIREGRRVKAVETFKSDDIARRCKYTDYGNQEMPCIGSYRINTESIKVTYLKGRAASFDDTIALGSYNIDVHSLLPKEEFEQWRRTLPSFEKLYLEKGLQTYPFQIPFGAMIPETTNSLLATAKNMGCTHLSNGAVRLHTSESLIGEAVGIAAAMAVEKNIEPRDIHSNKRMMSELQDRIIKSGVSLAWFEDINPGMSSYDRMQYAGARGYFKGYDNDDDRLPEFKPDDSLTRGQMALVIERVMGWQDEHVSGQSFSDVPPTSNFYHAVETLKKKEVTQGCGGGLFCVDDDVTRAQMMVFLIRAHNIPTEPYANVESFSDVQKNPGGHFAHDHIEAAADLGWVNGYPDGTFKPDDAALRKHIAIILYNVDFS